MPHPKPQIGDIWQYNDEGVINTWRITDVIESDSKCFGMEVAEMVCIEGPEANQEYISPLAKVPVHNMMKDNFGWKLIS